MTHKWVRINLLVLGRSSLLPGVAFLMRQEEEEEVVVVVVVVVVVFEDTC